MIVCLNYTQRKKLIVFNLKELVKTGFCRMSFPMDEPPVLINLQINAHPGYERDCCIFFVIDADRRTSDLAKMTWFNLSPNTTFQL